MDTTAHLFDLAPPRLRPPAGPTLPTTAAKARIAGDPPAVALRLLLPPGTWARVVDQQLFGAHPAILPADREDLDPARPVAVHLDVHPALLGEILGAPDPAAALAAGLADPSSPLGQTEHWRLRSAQQAAELAGDLGAAVGEALGGVEIGFATAWEGEHRAGQAPLPLAEAVAAALRQHGLAPVPFGATTVRARVVHAVGTWTLVVMMDPGVGLCTVYSAFPRPLDPALLPQADEALGRINSQLSMGALELDADDGQLRVRTGVDLGGPAPGVRVIARTVAHNLALMAEAWPTFDALATPA